MARVTGPLMSMEASGTIAGAITFAKWKGRPYARTHVIPANPNSGLQQSQRSMLRFLSRLWASLDPTEKASWATLASQLSVSPFNAYMHAALSNWTDRLPPVVTAGTPLAASTTDAPTFDSNVATNSISGTITKAGTGTAPDFYRIDTTGTIIPICTIAVIPADPSGTTAFNVTLKPAQAADINMVVYYPCKLGENWGDSAGG